MTTRLRLDRIASPLGDILVMVDAEDRLAALDFHDFEPRMRRLLDRQAGRWAEVPGPAPKALHEAVQAYFAGEPAALDAWPVALGGTDFQRAVWTALQAIPWGTTTSYGALAATLGRPSASRAVGLANGANPVAIRVPCHRVIGASGALTGYGGGLWRKQWLLRHEGAAERP